MASKQSGDYVFRPFGCPKCGERRMDYLANDDGVITCTSCGHVYDLEPKRRLEPVTGNCGQCNEIALLMYGLCEKCAMKTKVQVIRGAGRFSQMAMYLRSIARHFGKVTLGQLIDQAMGRR